ncbi:BatA domain-containing protein [Candidatus Latescibacterota bacterium]
MNFLNSILLYGLGAAVLPVIIHLIFRQRARTEAFPSIRLLETMKTDRLRRLRIKQLLVLLLRTLFIILIILAFARPAIRSAFRRNARTAAVLVVDGSASMQYIHDGESLTDRAVRKAGEIIDLLEHDDQAAVIIAGDEPLMLGSGLTVRKHDLVRALNNVELSYSKGVPAAAYQKAHEVLASSGVPNRELYYLTDGATTAFPDSLDSSDSSIRYYTVMIGPENRESPVLVDLELNDRLVTTGGAVTFHAEGYSDSGESDIVVEFFVDGERKARVPVTIRPTGRFYADFIFTPESAGWYSVSASVGDGRFEAGETRRIVLHVPQTVNVLLVGEKPEDFYFIEKALITDDEHSMFRIYSYTPNELIADHIKLADVIILSGVQSLPVNFYQSIRAAVVDFGAGLIVFPPGKLDTALYRDGIFRDVIPLKIVKQVSFDVGKDKGFVLMDRFDLNHPVLRRISREGSFQKPVVRAYTVLQPDGDISVSAYFSDGSIAVADSPCGHGWAIVFGVSATSVTSDLPLTGIFAPMLVRSVQYISDSFGTSGQYFSGEQVDEVLKDVGGTETVSLKPEDGPTKVIPMTYNGAGAEVEALTAGKPGFYSFMVQNSEHLRFSVDISRSEVIFDRTNSSVSRDVFGASQLRILEENENLASAITGDRFGTELFSIFLLAALAVLIIEMRISRKL